MIRDEVRSNKGYIKDLLLIISTPGLSDSERDVFYANVYKMHFNQQIPQDELERIRVAKKKTHDHLWESVGLNQRSKLKELLEGE